MKVLITGSEGFIGKNLQEHLKTFEEVELLKITRANNNSDLDILVDQADFIFHLASSIRSKEESDFEKDNDCLTKSLCSSIEKSLEKKYRRLPVVFTSTIQTSEKKHYHYETSKRKAENHLEKLKCNHKELPIYILRLPNIFGKWSKPNYNSVVATFCFNISRDLPINIFDSNSKINLIYIDDLIKLFINLLYRKGSVSKKSSIINVKHRNTIKIGDLAKKLKYFYTHKSKFKPSIFTSRLTKNLYKTYISFEPKEDS